MRDDPRRLHRAREGKGTKECPQLQMIAERGACVIKVGIGLGLLFLAELL